MLPKKNIFFVKKRKTLFFFNFYKDSCGPNPTLHPRCATTRISVGHLRLCYFYWIFEIVFKKNLFLFLFLDYSKKKILYLDNFDILIFKIY